ncbi:MAG: hypothetical protein ACK4G1_04515, partial [Ignavibacteria bacterium]
YNKIILSLNNSNQYDKLILSKEKFAGFLVNFIDTNISMNDFLELLKINPVLYGVSPKFNLMSENEKKNFYEYLLSFIGKKVEKL